MPKVDMANKRAHEERKKKKTKSHYNYVNLILVKNCYVHLSCVLVFILDPTIIYANWP